MHFDSILAVSDFTALSAHALERAALLARQHQTTLRLVHFADGPKTYLADPIARLGQRALSAWQCSTRGGELLCLLEGQRVKIAGQAHLLASGRLLLE